MLLGWAEVGVGVTKCLPRQTRNTSTGKCECPPGEAVIAGKCAPIPKPQVWRILGKQANSATWIDTNRTFTEFLAAAQAHITALVTDPAFPAGQCLGITAASTGVVPSFQHCSIPKSAPAPTSQVWRVLRRPPGSAVWVNNNTTFTGSLTDAQAHITALVTAPAFPAEQCLGITAAPAGVVPAFQHCSIPKATPEAAPPTTPEAAPPTTTPEAAPPTTPAVKKKGGGAAAVVGVIAAGVVLFAIFG